MTTHCYYEYDTSPQAVKTKLRANKCKAAKARVSV